MGWTIPTYSGTKATGKPSNYRIAMFELIRAINERRTAQGQVLLSIWRAADGTLVSSPSMDDLEDSPAYGHNSVTALNMQTISAQIVAPNLGVFGSGDFGKYCKPDLVTLWTVSGLEADIGHAIDSHPTRFNDAGWWQAMQDALDRMTIVIKDPMLSRQEGSPSSTITRYLSTEGSDTTFPYTAAGAWSSRNAFPHPDYSSSRFIGWKMTANYTPTLSSVTATMLRDNTLNAAAPASWDGSIVKSEIYYGFSQLGYSDPFGVTIDGHSISFSGIGTGTLTSTSFVAGSENHIEMLVTESEPGTVPFSVPPNISTTHHTLIQIGNSTNIFGIGTSKTAQCWLDMSSVLTDQS